MQTCKYAEKKNRVQECFFKAVNVNIFLTNRTGKDNFLLFIISSSQFLIEKKKKKFFQVF